jgi:amino acid permease
MLFYWPKGHHFFTGPKAPPLFGTDWHQYATDLPAIAFAFTGTFCLFPVFLEAKDKSYKGMDKSVLLSTLVCALGYQFVSVIGAFTFGRDIGQDSFSGGTSKSYLYDFPPDHIVVSICCLALVVVITLLYNVIEFPMISAVEELMQMLPLPECVDYRKAFLKWKLHRMLISICGMVVVVFINLQFKSLVVLFGLCGGYGITLVTYTIPSALVMVAPGISALMRVAMFLSLAASLFLVVMFTLVTF